jgi:endonuclease YncB( thermonuclease family)
VELELVLFLTLQLDLNKFQYNYQVLLAAQSFKNLSDVNVSTLEDGALIQYDSATDKFTTRTELSTTTGTLKFNGGNF